MKNIKLIAAAIGIFGASALYGQIQVQSPPTATMDGQNVFLDASGYIFKENNQGKGLYFPTTNLTSWTFITNLLDEATFPTAFDGMVVYNNGSGNTKNGQGQVVAVTPGFYYFSNPAQTTDISNGKWVRLGADAGTAANQYWSLTGNSGTTAGTNFIGTTDAQNMVVKTNSSQDGVSGYNATKIVMGNATDTPTFTKIVIGGTSAQQSSALATKTKSVTPAGQSSPGNFDFAMEVYGKSWFADGLVTSVSTYPDYVFDKFFTGKSKLNPEYKFMTLAETEKYIKEEKHLPGVTKIDELTSMNGAYMVDNSKLSIQTLEKVEELYLHLIQQQKEIEALKAEIKSLKSTN